MAHYTTAVSRPESPARHRVGAIRHVDGRNIVLALAIVAVGYLTIPPIVTVLVASLQTSFLSAQSEWTLSNYVRTFTDPAYLGLLANSLIFALGTTICATGLGAIFAWLLARTDIRFKPFLFLSATLPFFIPALLNTFANIFLMSPEIGLLNFVFEQLFGLRPFAIYSMPGMIYVQSLHLVPVAFALLVGIFQSMDVSLEESARVSGANTWQTLRYVTLRLAMPGLFSAALLIFVETVSSFEVPALIGMRAGIYVFVSEIYDALGNYPQDFSSASTLSTVVMAISMAGIYASNRLSNKSTSFGTITGKGFKSQPLQLGRWEWVALSIIALYFVFAVVLPLAVLVWVSLLPAYEMPSAASLNKISLENYAKVAAASRTHAAVINSLKVTLAAAAIVMLLSTIAAYIAVKTRLRGKLILEWLIFIPIAIPGAVLGVSVLFWYLMAPLPFALYGTLSIIIVGFVTLYLPYGIRFMTPAIIQIGPELEEAALTSGASFGRTLWRIYCPLILSSLLGGFFLVMILAFREVSAAVFLFAQGTEVFSLTLFNLWGEGFYGDVSALGIMMIIFSSIVVVLVRLLFGVRFMRPQRV